MNKTLPGILMVATIAFAACGNPPANNDVSASQPVNMPQSGPAQTQSATPSNIVQMNQPATVNPQTAQPQGAVIQTQPQAILPQTQPQQTTAKAGGALNPEHGKPGHRCDISVGSPLSSPVAANPQQQQQPKAITNNSPAQPQMQMGPQITPIQPAPSALPSAAKGRVNPAHGAPGHDCAKPVGAPLN